MRTFFCAFLLITLPATGATTAAAAFVAPFFGAFFPPFAADFLAGMAMAHNGTVERASESAPRPARPRGQPGTSSRLYFVFSITQK